MDQKHFYLALDAHSDHTQLAVLNAGGQLSSCKNYPTSGPTLIEAISAIKGHKTLVVEESQIADWVKRTLEAYVDRFAIADPKLNSWISKGQHIDDKVAAVRLARLLYGGYIQEVHHGDSKRQEFKELVLHYHDLTRQVVRFKNKLKAEFIAKALRMKGPAIYERDVLERCLNNLSDLPATVLQAQNYFEILNRLVVLKASVLMKIRSYYKLYPEINQFRLIPGFGQVTAFTLSALIDTPHRFKNKHKLWSYVGLSKSQKISNGTVYRSGPSHGGNRLLKYLLLSAARTAIRSKNDSVFKKTYVRLNLKGVHIKNIRRTIARQMLSIILKLWKSGEPFKMN